MTTVFRNAGEAILAMNVREEFQKPDCHTMEEATTNAALGMIWKDPTEYDESKTYDRLLLRSKEEVERALCMVTENTFVVRQLAEDLFEVTGAEEMCNWRFQNHNGRIVFWRYVNPESNVETQENVMIPQMSVTL